jgi:hypothetical protein
VLSLKPLHLSGQMLRLPHVSCLFVSIVCLPGDIICTGICRYYLRGLGDSGVVPNMCPGLCKGCMINVDCVCCFPVMVRLLLAHLIKALHLAKPLPKLGKGLVGSADIAHTTGVRHVGAS